MWRWLFCIGVLAVVGCQTLPENGITFFGNSNTESEMSQRSVAYYANFAAAQSEGATDTGRVPAWVPASATNLNEAHSVDTVQSLLAFTFDPADLATMTAGCQPIAAEEVQFPALAAVWWAEALRDAAGATSGGYTLYECVDDMGYLAVDTVKNQAYFWVP